VGLLRSHFAAFAPDLCTEHQAFKTGFKSAHDFVTLRLFLISQQTTYKAYQYSSQNLNSLLSSASLSYSAFALLTKLN
jgi:hypothetical protein